MNWNQKREEGERGRWRGGGGEGTREEYYRPVAFWESTQCLILCGTGCIVIFYWVLLRLTEKAMAPHSSTLAWKIPWTEEPGGLQSMRSRRVGHDWVTSLSVFTFMHWRRKWQPTPVFLPGESQERGSLVGCRLWGCTESHMPEMTWQQQQLS